MGGGGRGGGGGGRGGGGGGWEGGGGGGDGGGGGGGGVGAGRLIVSTVDARAWTDAHAEAAMTAMARVIYPERTARKRPLVDAKTASQFVNSQIGYQIARRSVIAAVLGIYLLLFVGVGWIEWRRGRAEGAVAIGLVLAVVTRSEEHTSELQSH